MRTTLLYFICLFSCSLLLKAQSHQALTDSIEQFYQISKINGFSVILVTPDSVLYQRGFGYSDIKTKKPYTTKTIQNIGSVSKTLIGIALLKAEELGHLKLDNPINEYLPFRVTNPYFPATPITIQHLATHTSTIKDTKYYDQTAYQIKAGEKVEGLKAKELKAALKNLGTNLSLGEYLEGFLSKEGEAYKKKNFLDAKPGSKFEYSNIGAGLAGYIIERACGITFDQFTQKYILDPLGMNASGWQFDQVDLANHSILYNASNIALPKYRLITYPDGGLLTNAEDLGKYLMELIKGNSGKGTLLSSESYKKLFTGQLNDKHFTKRNTSFAYNDEYNSGIFMGITPGGFLGHTGGDPGIVSFMFFDPEKDLGYILIINTEIRDKEGVKEFYGIWRALVKWGSD